jgi:hypothetical protein
MVDAQQAAYFFSAAIPGWIRDRLAGLKSHPAGMGHSVPVRKWISREENPDPKWDTFISCPDQTMVKSERRPKAGNNRERLFLTVSLLKHARTKSSTIVFPI